MDDRRAHDRLDEMDRRLTKFEANLRINTELTRTIAANTTELVDLVKGAKGLRKFVIWATPIVAAVLALWAYIKGN